MARNLLLAKNTQPAFIRRAASRRKRRARSQEIFSYA
jgi:hypothetical protein